MCLAAPGEGLDSWFGIESEAGSGDDHLVHPGPALTRIDAWVAESRLQGLKETHEGE
ncbi:MAG: hypothetical protein ACYSX0_06425 [Planctomycetota bacterium]|jgi:hydrogenase maturation factor